MFKIFIIKLFFFYMNDFKGLLYFGFQLYALCLVIF